VSDEVEAFVGIVALILALPATLLKIVRNLGRQSPRERLMLDIQIRNALHANSESQRIFDEYIRQEALRIAGVDSKRRDPFGITLAVIFIVVGVASAWLVVSAGGWWWLAAPIPGFFLLFGAVGLASDLQRKERDEKGRAV